MVIATLLQNSLEVFGFMLNELKESDLINKIIIIDNTEDNSFDKTFDINEKFLILKPNGNIFVNPAWNLGVKNVESEYFFILNDDILLTRETIKLVYNLYKSKDDIRALSVECVISSRDNKLNDEIISHKKFIEELGDDLALLPYGSRQGYFVMMKKDYWIEIPEDLKIFCGDDFMFDITEYKFPKKQNYKTNKPLIYNYPRSTIRNIILDDYLLRETELLVNKYFPDKPLDFYKGRFYMKHIKR